ncbi:hypothetical protein BU26DRAFT_129424 [Trematosphaeria pertusa]|uniref:Uncharacterized protein n=1 Tax=Trematosphaeria pertusa TaxID=390896 RepID=A0A6A6HWM8_9PLEO|nr:uncharacterized protein BU26DRAFT_129424 [Trematosphaeria pertusa]KAF2242605.1 hypothetical protein BU26DRAFT_129424 [Trematosphaeria pertusa]
MALAGATGPAHLSSSDPSPLPLRPALQSHSQVDLGSVNHTGDNVASPNYGAQVGGHIVGLDQSQIHVTTSNAHHYNLAAGTILNIATGAVDERMVIIDWLGSLSGLDFSSMHRANLSKRHHGTGMWFLEYEKFIAWCDGSIRTLWCHGIRKRPSTGSMTMQLTQEQLARGKRYSRLSSSNTSKRLKGRRLPMLPAYSSSSITRIRGSRPHTILPLSS